MSIFTKTSKFPVSLETLFQWHCTPLAFERLTPPFEKAKVIERIGGISNGGQVVISLKIGPFSYKWLAVHKDFELNHRFTDEQRKGPFAHWVHTHMFESNGPAGSILTDYIDYQLPFGKLGKLLGETFVMKKMQRLFTWRHERTRRDLIRHAAFAQRSPLRIAITGASGLIGSALSTFLTTGGHEVLHFVRGRAAGANEIAWEPEKNQIDVSKMEGLDGIVHLAGENITSHRWSKTQKEKIRNSRILGTRTLCQAILKLQRPPKVLISGSAIGIYGNRGDEILDESSSLRDDFLAQVCQDWEQEALPVEQKGVRLVRLRTGIALSAQGGALASMLPIFKTGFGGKMGSGKQWLSWISLDDLVYAIHFALMTDALSGSVNAVSPKALPQEQFAKILGRVLQRPTLVPTPSFALRALFGEMADAALLAGQHVQPTVLINAGFLFEDQELEPFLRFELGKMPALK